MLELTQMIRFMAMAVIGGLGVFGGPIVGVVVVVGVSELLRGLGDVRLLVWGLMLLVVILFFPSGIAGSSIQRGLLRDQLKALRQFVTGSRGEER
jgi:branched-chain amino acid transport system permease protein